GRPGEEPEGKEGVPHRHSGERRRGGPPERNHPGPVGPPGELLRTHRKRPRPFVVMFVGVNGTGKTTTIAKLAYHLQKKGFTCVVAAADTFRAGAIEQLEKHGEAIGFKLIKHQAGADPAAVAFDAVEHARARGRDVVLIDTAG